MEEPKERHKQNKATLFKVALIVLCIRKPNFVVDNHLSRSAIASKLKRHSRLREHGLALK